MAKSRIQIKIKRRADRGKPKPYKIVQSEAFIAGREANKFQKGKRQPATGKLPSELGALGGLATGEIQRGEVLLSKAYLRALAHDPDDMPRPRTVAEQIAQALVQATNGTRENRHGEVVVEVGAARELREPTEGKLADKHQISGPNGEPIPVQAPVVFQVTGVKPEDVVKELTEKK